MPSKHQRLVYNPDNKRTYFYSGDYPGPPFQSSFHTDMFSYDITKSASSDQSDFQNWILEWPYCGLANQISPVATDEAPFAWDSKRHIFWITGGWEVSGQDAVKLCGNGATFYGSSVRTTANPQANAPYGPDILQFDPRQNGYIRPDAKFKLPNGAMDQYGRPLLGSAQTPRHSVYNPVTDEIQLPSAPSAGYAPVVTYDSKANVLVVWVESKIYLFFILLSRDGAIKHPQDCRVR